MTCTVKYSDLYSVHYLCASVPGADVVLGHIMKSNEGGVPSEQQLCRYRHSPGSGILTVEVRSDGPTRVLRITDHNKKVSVLEACVSDWVGRLWLASCVIVSPFLLFLSSSSFRLLPPSLSLSIPPSLTSSLPSLLPSFLSVSLPSSLPPSLYSIHTSLHMMIGRYQIMDKWLPPGQVMWTVWRLKSRRRRKRGREDSNWM